MDEQQITRSSTRIAGARAHVSHVADVPGRPSDNAHKGCDDQALQRIGLGDVAAEQPGGERLGRAAQLGPGKATGPAVVLTVTAR
jgi:hypothetical protein